jgi:hypothetical protein
MRSSMLIRVLPMATILAHRHPGGAGSRHKGSRIRVMEHPTTSQYR